MKEAQGEFITPTLMFMILYEISTNIKRRKDLKQLLMVTVLLPFLGHAQQPDWKSVEEIFGKKGVAQEDMLKLTFPRSDLHVTIGDVIIEPGLALTRPPVLLAPMAAILGDRAGRMAISSQVM